MVLFWFKHEKYGSKHGNKVSLRSQNSRKRPYLKIALRELNIEQDDLRSQVGL